MDFPTRCNNIIDLVLCSDRNLLGAVRSGVPFLTNEYNAILCEMIPHSASSVQEGTRAVKQCIMKANYELINAFLATLYWDEIDSNCTATEEYWHAFKGIANTIVFNFCALCTSYRQW